MSSLNLAYVRYCQPAFAISETKTFRDEGRITTSNLPSIKVPLAILVKSTSLAETPKNEINPKLDVKLRRNDAIPFPLFGFGPIRSLDFTDSYIRHIILYSFGSDQQHGQEFQTPNPCFVIGGCHPSDCRPHLHDCGSTCQIEDAVSGIRMPLDTSGKARTYIICTYSSLGNATICEELYVPSVVNVYFFNCE